MTRWAETEDLAEQWFRAELSKFATRKGRAGHIDIVNIEGLAPEVKATAVWETRWLKTPDPLGRIKFILWRPPKFGPASVGSWPMVFRAEEATRLLREAGYGDESL